jgi:hypothetical protein
LQDAQWAVGNSRGARKLARTPTLIKKKKKQHGTYSDLSSTRNKYAYQSKSQQGWLSGTQKEGHEQVCFWRSRGDGLLSFSCLMR